ncbi:unnamed protein product [Mycena citricolor]|uniref:U3 small nucleolar RNA-associated protein 22 n=1 Tax=Mycena citricolor TaxID=2018698 RepID=A0AAD2H388_9AGAR|nr:unnamed protein product [Mycena citricolor]
MEQPPPAVDIHVKNPSKKLNLPPTGEELRAISDAKDLYKSNTFKLQIDALLPNVQPKESHISPLDRFLVSLHGTISGIPAVSPQHPLEAARKLLKKGVAVSYAIPRPTEDTNWKVAFQPPSDITVVGSWANKISVKGKDGSKFGVDVAVEMPSHLFQEKDYLNGRFFHKRAFYLATVAAHLKHSKDLNIDVSYESAFNDPRLTKLVLEPRKDTSPYDFSKLNARVCIIPVLSLAECPIPLHRLSPAHSNLRVASDSETQAPLPSPIYNARLLTSLLPKPQLLAAYAVKEHTPCFPQALALLRVWANQRGYGQGTRLGVRGFDSLGSWWAALLTLLVSGESPQRKGRRKPLGKGLSSYQLFKAALDFLAKHDFSQDPVYLKTSEGDRYPSDEYEAHHETVFVESTSLVNMLAGVPLGSLQLLQIDAQSTLERLNMTSTAGDPFPEIFLKDHRDLPSRFDALLRVDISSAKPRTESRHVILDRASAVDGLIDAISQALRHGLGDRTKAVAILHTTTCTRPLSQALPTDPNVLFIGLIFDPRHAFRLVDHGPSADEPDPAVAERFREFWGDKAELRRFKDGRIVESVVWDVQSADQRSRVPIMVASHILQRHFGLGDDVVQASQQGFDPVLKLPENISRVHTSSGAVLGFKGAMDAFDGVVKQIKALNDQLPLSVALVSAASEYLRYTSVFAPVPLSAATAGALPENARFQPAIEMVIQFEKSAQWPDELRAIQKIKLAFFERIARGLVSAVPGLTAAVVASDNTSIEDTACLQIVTADGWAFVARIWHDREATLLDRIISGKGLLSHIKSEAKKDPGRQAASEAKDIYLRRFIHAPRHHRAIAGLNHVFPAYAPTVRLVKRWLASHWVLQAHLSEEAVELLCAAFFVGDGRELALDSETRNAERASVPGSKERGFACVVRFLKDWQWEDGLHVPLYGDVTAPSVSPVAVQSVWRLMTELDPVGSVWTRQGPDVIVAQRIRALAKATWDCLLQMENGHLDVKSLFVHPTNDYDVIVRLNSSRIPRHAQNIEVALAAQYTNPPRADEVGSLRPGFDPIRDLFNDIQVGAQLALSLVLNVFQRVYADTLKLFYDPLGGDRFGIVWVPTLRQPRPFRVLAGFSAMPVIQTDEPKNKSSVVLNESGVLKEIERVGLGLISDITVQI